MERNLAKVYISAKSEKTVKFGHPWVYGTEITSIDGACENGDLVDVYSSKNRWIGTGFINRQSKICVRIFSRDTNAIINEQFWERRVRYALAYRQTVMGEDFDCCRLIFGEADLFPGLTVDLFHDVLVTECLSLGIELRKDIIYTSLVRVLEEIGHPVRAIYERNESQIRELEGLPLMKGFYPFEGWDPETPGEVTITENGIQFTVDFVEGQKTGYFLDQKYNRLAVAKISRGKHVLDCFTHTGAFALNAAKAEAASVVAVDVSQDALDMASRNALQNGLSGKISFVCADVFDYLTSVSGKGRKEKPFDLVILDPPAFTKSNKTVHNAYQGYKQINQKAMQILPRGGYLATCSCSHFMTDELFRQMLLEASYDAGVQLRQIEGRQQGPDHPILWRVPETDYLKFYIFQIV